MTKNNQKIHYQKPSEMTKKELKSWIEWAEEELEEYKDFIQELKVELSLREK